MIQSQLLVGLPIPQAVHGSLCRWVADYRRLVSPGRKSYAETYGEFLITDKNCPELVSDMHKHILS